MANKRPIQTYKDNNFLLGFQRFFLIDYILESKDWKELSSKIRKFYNKPQSDFFEGILFKEFKFYSLVKEIEMILADSFMTFLIEEGLIRTEKEKIKKIFADQTKKHRQINDSELNEVFSQNRIIDLRGLLNPFCIFDLCGYGLGDLHAFINNHTKDFDEKKNLLTKISNFIGYRNLIFHNLLSNRISLVKELNDGLDLGIKLQDLLKNYPKKLTEYT